jgi:hypothetical protein
MALHRVSETAAAEREGGQQQWPLANSREMQAGEHGKHKCDKE